MPYLVPIVERSGPTHCPCPCTRWQVAQALAGWPWRRRPGPCSASPFSADQLADRRQGAARGPLGQRQEAGGLAPDPAVGVVVGDRGRLALEVVGELALPDQVEDLAAPAVAGPGVDPEGLAAEAERVVIAGDHRQELRVGVAEVGQGPDGGLGDRGRAALLGLGDQAVDELGGPRRPYPADGLDGGDPDGPRRPWCPWRSPGGSGRSGRRSWPPPGRSRGPGRPGRPGSTRSGG